MSIIQCRKGHFYDDTKYDFCPYCNQLRKNKNCDSVPKTRPYSQKEETDGQVDPDSFRTIALDVNESGINPVCGWLIALNGKNRGVAYSLCCGRNTVGRGERVDIDISDDMSVSRGSNATIAYDERNNSFSLICGEGRNIVYINDSPLYSTALLEDYDIVEVGRTKLLFHALCGDRFKWESTRD